MMRALPAGLIALLIARQLPRGSWWWKSLVLGTLNMGAFFPLLFLAAQELPGGVAATLGAAQPIVIAFLAVAILHERLSVWRVCWGVLGMAGVALVVLLLPALLVDGVPPGIDGTAWLGYAWLGIVGALITYTLWFAGIRRLPVTATALLGLLSPLVAAILGAVIAGEALTPVQLLGFALALLAMVAGQLPSPTQKAQNPS